jgi:predicted dehydrogenase
LKKLNIGIIGYKFMGRTHSNAWKKASNFFDLPFDPVLKVACGRNKENLQEFAEKWGWEEIELDWRELIARKDIDIIDIALPQHLHYEIVLEAARAGKHIFCEKPMAMNSSQAAEMLLACKENGVLHYLNHNYRRAPAIALAKNMIDQGLVGQIYHWRSAYQQDWITDPEFPLTWQLQKEKAQAGPQWDLNSHCVDLAHYLVGSIKDVTAVTSNFILQRPLAEDKTQGNLKASASTLGMGEVTVEDAALMLVNFANGAVGSFEATRFANGCKNKLTFEIYGSKGSLVFNLERMNEIQFYSNLDPSSNKGFKNILVTEESHPYIGNWWPPGHIIGYEHTFIHAVADFIKAIADGNSIYPNFEDGLEVIKVLECGIQSSLEKRSITIE